MKANVQLATTRDIAKMLGLSEGHVRNRLVHYADFPQPIPHFHRPKKWFLSDVISFLKQKK